MTYGVDAGRVTVAADLAWALDACPMPSHQNLPECLRVGSEDVLVGVNVTNEQFVAKRAPHLFESLAGFLDRLVEKFAARPVFFCNEIREDESFDKAASRLVIARMKHHDRAAILSNEYRSPQTTMELIGRCSLVVGMRYHFCVFAAIQGVPFIALKRSDKVDDLCSDLAWTYGAGLDEIDVSLLEGMAAELLGDGPRATNAIAERVELMRQRVWRNYAALDALREARGR
jgi:polysaccharide pyruvyl transferase WcaK-like protein